MLECTVYICDFHRLQAWQRWLNTSSHGLAQGKEEVLALLKKLAKAPTETAYETALQSLKESQYWKTNSDLRNWFEKKWLCENKANEREIYYCGAKWLAKWTKKVLIPHSNHMMVDRQCNHNNNVILQNQPD